MNALKSVNIFLIVVLMFSCKEKQSVLKNEIPSVKYSDYNGKLSSGLIKRIENFPSKYVRSRNVDIWLPENYSKGNKYAVLYMHDGQNLFDATTTWNKQEWMIEAFRCCTESGIKLVPSIAKYRRGTPKNPK